MPSNTRNRKTTKRISLPPVQAPNNDIKKSFLLMAKLFPKKAFLFPLLVLIEVMIYSILEETLSMELYPQIGLLIYSIA